MNVFTCTGNLGSDCKVNNVGGSAVCNFSVAVKSGYGDKAQTFWLDCALWGKQAESGLVNYLLKGQQIAVSGELGTREHEGKTYITLRVNNVSLIGSKPDNQQQAQPAQQPSQQKSEPSFDDDVPF